MTKPRPTRLFVSLQRKGGKDFVNVISCDSWGLAIRFPVETQDLEDITISPNGCYVLALENPLFGRM